MLSTVYCLVKRRSPTLSFLYRAFAGSYQPPVHVYCDAFTRPGRESEGQTPPYIKITSPGRTSRTSRSHSPLPHDNVVHACTDVYLGCRLQMYVSRTQIKFEFQFPFEVSAPSLPRVSRSPLSSPSNAPLEPSLSSRLSLSLSPPNRLFSTHVGVPGGMTGALHLDPKNSPSFRYFTLSAGVWLLRNPAQ